MFVRKKWNKSGTVSIQIISKEQGYRVIETVGCSSNKDELDRLFLKAKQKIHADPKGQQWLFSFRNKEELAIENFVKDLSNAQIRTIGPELIFGALFDRIGFNKIENELFRYIVITRLAYPTSKLKTIDYLRRYRGIDVSVDRIYLFMDKFNNEYKEDVEEIAYKHSKKQLGNISVVFYDVTTLYFESEDEDDLRKIGFSKDGKFQCPQILLGLLVGEQGLPIGYDIFEGNKFEGHTLMPVLKQIQVKYGFKKPIVVADAALLSKQNLENLDKEEYKFIIGARIKNETDTVKEKILTMSKGMRSDESIVIKKGNGIRLIVTYSQKRAVKDAMNRQKGIKRLRQQVQSGKLTKQSINSRGYNKFLTIRGKAEVVIDEDKIKADEQWDGLKGYITNTNLSVKRVTENYVHLWQIEKAFRISKTDLKVRPIYHYQKRRIEAHICISFVAYTIYKELECLLKKHEISMSPKRAAELTHNMYELEYALPSSGMKNYQLLKMDNEQQLLFDAIYN